MTIREVMAEEEEIFNFSRILIYNETIDHVTRPVLTKQLFKESLKDDTVVTLASIKKDIFSINENIPVAKALDLFIICS
ncbi:MAG: hypothetical protein IE889_01435 [Campylobacterales bacterium]|nr:hypothetical protein [Campylobacterales bacterium]